MTDYFLPVLWAAVLLDLLLGDPRWLPHPVRLMGWLAVRLERFSRTAISSERAAGCLTVILLLVVVAGITGGLLVLAAGYSNVLFLVTATLLLYTTVATRDLLRHSRAVYEGLQRDLDEGRRAVSMIVGRDTERLDEAGVVRACVESVAENMSDGIVAPILWAFAGAVCGLIPGDSWPVVCGVTSAMVYKAINTMDSMFGYKNEQYLHFGATAARLDDAVNRLPARLSGSAIAAAAPLCGGSMTSAWRILLRDHGKHTSPNAGWPEAAMAGALGLQLGGKSSYFGNLTVKPLLGEGRNGAVPIHISRANVLVLVASLLCLLILTLLYLFVRTVLH